MIVEVENAILARLTEANDGRLGYKLASIDSYGGEFDEEIDQVIRRLPAAWVVFGGAGKPAPWGVAKRAWRVPATFVVMVGARSVRAEPFTRRGLERDGQVLEVGAYRMLEDVRRLMLGQDFGLPIRRLEPGAVRTLYNTRLNGLSLSVFAQEWHTQWTLATAADGTDPAAADLLRIGLDYDLVPLDGTPDAGDLISLNP